MLLEDCALFLMVQAANLAALEGRGCTYVPVHAEHTCTWSGIQVNTDTCSA